MYIVISEFSTFSPINKILFTGPTCVPDIPSRKSQHRSCAQIEEAAHH